MPITFRFSDAAVKRNRKSMKEAMNDPDSFADKLHLLWEAGVEKRK
jgi:hypothetical protein